MRAEIEPKAGSTDAWLAAGFSWHGMWKATHHRHCCWPQIYETERVPRLWAGWSADVRVDCSVRV